MSNLFVILIVVMLIKNVRSFFNKFDMELKPIGEYADNMNKEFNAFKLNMVSWMLALTVVEILFYGYIAVKFNIIWITVISAIIIALSVSDIKVSLEFMKKTRDEIITPTIGTYLQNLLRIAYYFIILLVLILGW